ncbi:DUF1427 family protein [Brucella pseudogrignonensis]|uniref:DUF1427 family protein n=1 Tax=Brucella pseudogrignonensis TaxID=419475 RepID=UPI0039C6B43A
MKIYVLSLFAGILAGEQIIPFAKSIMAKEPAVISWLHQVKPHVFGHMPVGQSVAERKNAKQNNDT